MVRSSYVALLTPEPIPTLLLGRRARIGFKLRENRRIGVQQGQRVGLKDIKVPLKEDYNDA
jgi:hypothetical protein